MSTTGRFCACVLHPIADAGAGRAATPTRRSDRAAVRRVSRMRDPGGEDGLEFTFRVDALPAGRPTRGPSRRRAWSWRRSRSRRSPPPSPSLPFLSRPSLPFLFCAPFFSHSWRWTPSCTAREWVDRGLGRRPAGTRGADPRSGRMGRGRRLPAQARRRSSSTRRTRSSGSICRSGSGYLGSCAGRWRRSWPRGALERQPRVAARRSSARDSVLWYAAPQPFRRGGAGSRRAWRYTGRPAAHAEEVDAVARDVKLTSADRVLFPEAGGHEGRPLRVLRRRRAGAPAPPARPPVHDEAHAHGRGHGVVLPEAGAEGDAVVDPDPRRSAPSRRAASRGWSTSRSSARARRSSGWCR